MKFLNWLFSSPASIITIISVVIAYIAYNFQRKQSAKRIALEFAEKYSKEFIPRIRYINCILKSIGAYEYISGFTKYSDFTSEELIEFLKDKNFDIDDFKNLFGNISVDNLISAFSCSGGNTYICSFHYYFMEIMNNPGGEIKNAFYKFVVDMVNDLEAATAMFHYNVGDERVVYLSLHQTFLAYMKIWYFFISERNVYNHDRYFINIIWLYKKWDKRRRDNENRIKKIIDKKSDKNKLH